MENEILKLADEYQEKASKIITDTNIVSIWESIGAEPHLVGSLSMGLLMKHRDIDFHIYSDKLIPSESFAAMARIADNLGIRRVEYSNLIDTDEACIEWHAWYENSEGELWQLDMIHIQRGSTYDGYFEKMAEQISARLTPEIRYTILSLKYDTPEDEKIMGIEYYMAVIRDGVRTYDGFTTWRKLHPLSGIIEWIPE